MEFDINDKNGRLRYRMSGRSNFLREALADALKDFYRMDTRKLIYKDIEKMEEICNNVIADSDIPISKIKIEWGGTTPEGFIIPQTIRYTIQ